MGMEQRGIRADLRKDNLDNLTEGGFGEDQSKCREIARRAGCVERRTSGSVRDSGRNSPGLLDKNWEKQRLWVVKVQAKAARQRLDRLHKISREIVSGHDAVFAEDLNISGMMKNHHLARSVQDASWGELQRQPKYKCEREGKVFATEDRFFPSSQLCSACGEKNPIVKDLSIREWTCPHCGAHHDRDINACAEGKRKALSQQHDDTSTVGSTGAIAGNACGGDVSPFSA